MTTLHKTRRAGKVWVPTVAAAITLLVPAFAHATQQSSSATPAKKSTPQTQPAKPPADPLAPLLTQAQQALDREDYNAAIPLLKQIEDAKPQDALPHFEMGYAYSELRRNDEAAAEYRRALELNPALAAADVNLGLVLMDSDSASALEAFKRAEALLPDQGQPHLLAGRTLERAGKLPEAVEEYKTAVELAPKDAATCFALAQSLLNSGRDADAEAQFRQVLAITGDTSQSASPAAAAEAAPAELGLAEALVRERKLDAAVDAFAAYLSTVPADHEARFARAVTLQNLDRFDDALAELDRLGKDAEPTAETLKLRGSIYLQQKRWTEAAAVLKKAGEIAPTDAETFGWLGRAQIELRNYPEAAATLRRSLSIDATQVASLRSLAEADYLSGQYSATLLALDQLAQRETLQPVDLFFRAICHDKLGQKAEAVAAYQQFLSADHNSNPDQEWESQQRLNFLLKELQKK